MNYPDDIGFYNNHPASPFYNPVVCSECREELELDYVEKEAYCINNKCKEYMESK